MQIGCHVHQIENISSTVDPDLHFLMYEEL